MVPADISTYKLDAENPTAVRTFGEILARVSCTLQESCLNLGEILTTMSPQRGNASINLLGI